MAMALAEDDATTLLQLVQTRNRRGAPDDTASWVEEDSHAVPIVETAPGEVVAPAPAQKILSTKKESPKVKWVSPAPAKKSDVSHMEEALVRSLHHLANEKVKKSSAGGKSAVSAPPRSRHADMSVPVDSARGNGDCGPAPCASGTHTEIDVGGDINIRVMGGHREEMKAEEAKKKAEEAK